MKKLIIIAAIALDAIMAVDKIGFVFEVNRHGARAPVIDEEPGLFQVPEGMLTASGMRQRHLLGKFNR